MKMKNKIIYDKDGTIYEKHSICHAGLATGEGYFRVSDEDSDKTLVITLTGGIFGLHHFLRGDYYRGLLYLLTGGGFGILFISDVIRMITGNYSYFEVNYENNEYGRLIRRKEKVYLRKIEDMRIKIAGIPVSLLLSAIIVFLLYIPGYQKANRIFAQSASYAIESTMDSTNCENLNNTDF